MYVEIFLAASPYHRRWAEVEQNRSDKTEKKSSFHCGDAPALVPLVADAGVERQHIFAGVRKYYLVRPCGDLDEDAVDSRISCTQLWVLRKLEPQEFFLHALAYMADHPQMPDGCDVKRERAQAWNGYAVLRGKHPRAKGKLGDILAFAREAVNGPKIEHLSLCVIDGKERLPDTWYDDNFEECEAV